MPVFVIGEERSWAALDRRLFRADVSEAAKARVRQVIRDENPEVDFDDLRAGVVLRLPRRPELRARTDLAFDDSVGEAVGATRDQLTEDLKLLSGQARSRLRDDAAARQVLAKQLGSRELRAAASQDEAVAEALDSALKGVEEDAAGDEVRQAVVKEAVGDWVEGLQSLDRLVP